MYDITFGLLGVAECYLQPPAFQAAVERQFGVTRQQQSANNLAYGSPNEIQKKKAQSILIAEATDRTVTGWLEQLFEIGGGSLAEDRFIDLFSKIRQDYGNRELMVYVKAIERGMKAGSTGSETDYGNIVYSYR